MAARQLITLQGTIGASTFDVSGTTDDSWKNVHNQQAVHGHCNTTKPDFQSGGGLLYPGKPYVPGQTATVMWARSGQQLPDWQVFEIDDASTRTFVRWIQDGLGYIKGAKETLVAPDGFDFFLG